jgi:Fe-S-cluster containining protein
MVWINPWELACLAAAKKVSPREFRDHYTEPGGIRLRFDGAPDRNGLPACSMYLPRQGCSVHPGRPLSCRLYPLGREKRGDSQRYLHRGHRFPCLDGCPEVTDLPHLSISAYLAAQEVARGEAAQDAYLDLMQHLADGAFALLIESGLAATGDRQTLRLWRKLGRFGPAERADFLGALWSDRLTLPDIGGGEPGDPVLYVKKHHDLLQSAAQEAFGSLPDAAALRSASGIMMALALQLGCALGADSADCAAHWIATAKGLGARD